LYNFPEKIPGYKSPEECFSEEAMKIIRDDTQNQHKPFIFRNYRVHLWEKSRVKTASCLTATLDFPSAFAQKTVKMGLMIIMLIPQQYNYRIFYNKPLPEFTRRIRSFSLNRMRLKTPKTTELESSQSINFDKILYAC